jgi:hypothetical protein
MNILAFYRTLKSKSVDSSTGLGMTRDVSFRVDAENSDFG